jgi:hypothetical protein
MLQYVFNVAISTAQIRAYFFIIIIFSKRDECIYLKQVPSSDGSLEPI